jgi:hypothetical protein
VKLYLDDTRPAPAGWTAVRDLAEAQRHLASGKVEQLSLDYDLTPDRAPDAPTGHDLLTWMHQTGHWPRYAPKVHSGNPAGAKQMKAFIAQHANRDPAPKTPKSTGTGNTKPLSKGGSTRYTRASKAVLY